MKPTLASGGTVVEWYKQRQYICESGRFSPCANCRDKRSRLKEVERILVKNRGGDDSMQRIRYGMCVCMYVCVRERVETQDVY